MSDDKEPQGNPWMKSLAIWAGILLALVLFVSIFDSGTRTAGPGGIAYSEFLTRVDEGQVRDAEIAGNIISGHLSNGTTFRTYAPDDPTIVQRLAKNNVAFAAKPEAQPSIWQYILVQSLPFLLMIGIGFFVFRQMQKNSGSGAMGFGKSRAKLLTENETVDSFVACTGMKQPADYLEDMEKRKSK